MTETARLAHYVLPAASQFEKWECTGFNLEFPDNAFHLRHPLLPAARGGAARARDLHAPARGDGRDPARVPAARAHRADRAARPPAPRLPRRARRDARGAPALAPYAASIALSHARPRTPARTGAAAAAPAACRSRIALRRASTAAPCGAPAIAGSGLTLGEALFQAILDGPAGTRRQRARVRRHLVVPSPRDGASTSPSPRCSRRCARCVTSPRRRRGVPFVLLAGERRSYNANQIFRDPAWRKADPDGAMRDAPRRRARPRPRPTARAPCASRRAGEIEVTIELDDSLRRGMVTLPHGYGMRYDGGPRRAPSSTASRRRRTAIPWRARRITSTCRFASCPSTHGGSTMTAKRPLLGTEEVWRRTATAWRRA